MSEPKLNIKEETSTKKTRSPPKKAKVEQTVPKKKKLKTDAPNDWLDNDDQDPITAEIFAKRITMGELAFRNDGTIEVYYDDDDIFWGHCIIAHIDADGNPADADIAG